MHNKIWKELAEERRPDTGYVRRRIPVPSEIDVFLALALPDNRPTLLVEIAVESIPPDKMEFYCCGFNLRSTVLKPSLYGRMLLILELVEWSFLDVFYVLIDDVLNCLKYTPNEKVGVRTLLDRLSSWQDFFQHHKEEILSAHEQQGLYGELWFLRNVLLCCLVPEIAVSAWTGPDAANQDFHLPNCAVEVKTTTSNPHEKVTISNVLQLDETGLPALYMLHLALDIRRNIGETLPQLVILIRQHLEGVAPQMTSTFNTQLVKAGYLQAHSAQYIDNGYSIRHVRLYHVQDRFPHLRECALPQGVGDVKYSIIVSACGSSEIPLDDFQNLLKKDIDYANI